MIRSFSLLSAFVLLASAASLLTGCLPQQPFYLFEDGDLSHYIGRATDIEYPDVDSHTLGEVDGATRPLSLQNAEPREIWDLSLEEAVQTSLANSKVLKRLGGQVSPMAPPEFLVNNPMLATTVYDPAITESDPRQGVEAALAAFDTQLRSNVFWEKNDMPQNVGNLVSPFRPPVYEQDLGTFQAQLQKTAATGGTWSVRHNVQYEWNNQEVPQARGFASDWNVNLEAEMRQPLLQGAGVQFNRIAGPGAVPGFYNGVVIARINTDIRLADFEAGVRESIADVEMAYWELYFAYRNLDAVVDDRDRALETWRKVHARKEGTSSITLAEARYFQSRNSVDQALDNLYASEAKLRYLLGLAATDGRLIRPTDEPISAKVIFDWHEALGEALARNAELREQKWIVKRREMELIASKNFLVPRLDAVGRYRWRGLGNHLLRSGASSDFQDPDSSAYAVMTGGNFQEWQLGLEFSMPLGFRREMAGVRNAELLLARERAMLQEMELEISHQLAHYTRQVESQYMLMHTHWNHRLAAQRRLPALEQDLERSQDSHLTASLLHQLADAQQRLVMADSQFFRSVVEYNRAIVEVHKRKGSLLEHNGVFLAEGPWPAKAYFDAHRRARQRDAGVYLDYGFTRPGVISRGSIEQGAGHPGASYVDALYGEPAETWPDADGEPVEPTRRVEPGGLTPEAIPTPSPAPLPAERKAPSPPMPEPEPQAARAPSGTKVAAEGPRVPGLQKVDVGVRLQSLDGLAKPDGQQSGGAKAATGWSAAKQVAFEQPVAETASPAAPPAKAAAPAPSGSSGWRNVRQ